MPTIDVYASAGTFSDTRKLVEDLASAAMRWEQVSNLAFFRDNTPPSSTRCRPPRSPLSPGGAITNGSRYGPRLARSTWTSRSAW
jgi:hypothetical protein